jgi:hypothetical protein
LEPQDESQGKASKRKGGNMSCTKATRSTVVILLALVIVTAVSVSVAFGQSFYDPNTITLINRSGEDALVRLVGPTRRDVTVVDGTNQTVNVVAGSYYMLVRYGRPGRYHYTRGNQFEIEQSGLSYTEMTITLHKVVGGNYGTRPSTAAEFDRIR